MRHRTVLAVLLAACLLAPAALAAAPAPPQPAPAVSLWEAAVTQVRGFLVSLLPQPERPLRAHRPGPPGAQADNCSNMDPNGHCLP